MSKYPVAVVKTDEANIGVAIEHGISLLGGIGRFIRRGDLVAIKVNMFIHATPESGRITHPKVAIEVARLCHEQGARVVVIERTPNLELDFEPYPEIRRYADVLCMDYARHTPKPLPGARSLRDEVDWADILDDCDVFINIPGLRTHALARFSNALKNLMGVLPRSSTFRVHMYGLEGCIVDLNVARPSDLIITDAIYTLVGNFPAEGTPIYTGFITIADNVVAADLVAAHILGVNPEEAHTLAEAHERGLGPASLAEVMLLGDDLGKILEGVTITPAACEADLEALSKRFTIYADNACAPCRQALAGGLIAAQHYAPDLVESLSDLTVVCGPQPKELEIKAENVLYYGNCTYAFRNKGTQIPGCPPLSGYVLQGLRKMAPLRPRPSLCSIAWKESPIQAVIPIAAEAGYEGLEIWGPHIERYLQEGGRLSDLKKMLKDAGLAVPMISPYFDFVKDMEGSLVVGARFVEYASALGSPLIRVFTGGGASANVDHQTWETVVRGLKALCQTAKEKHIDLAIETHQGHLHDTSASTLRLIRKVGTDNLGINLDIHNLFDMGEDPILALRLLMPWVRIIHLKNGRYVNGKLVHGVPLAEGDMEYSSFLLEVLRQNYGGFASIEWFGADPAQAVRSELAYLKRQWSKAGADRGI